MPVVLYPHFMWPGWCFGMASNATTAKPTCATADCLSISLHLLICRSFSQRSHHPLVSISSPGYFDPLTVLNWLLPLVVSTCVLVWIMLRWFKIMKTSRTKDSLPGDQNDHLLLQLGGRASIVDNPNASKISVHLQSMGESPSMLSRQQDKDEMLIFTGFKDSTIGSILFLLVLLTVIGIFGGLLLLSFASISQMPLKQIGLPFRHFMPLFDRYLLVSIREQFIVATFVCMVVALPVSFGRKSLRNLFRVPCSLTEATHVVVLRGKSEGQGDDMARFLHDDSCVGRLMAKIHRYFGGGGKAGEQLLVQKEEEGTRYFVYELRRWVLGGENDRPVRYEHMVASTVMGMWTHYHAVLKEGGQSEKELEFLRRQVGLNLIPYEPQPFLVLFAFNMVKPIVIYQCIIGRRHNFFFSFLYFFQFDFLTAFLFFLYSSCVPLH